MLSAPRTLLSFAWLRDFALPLDGGADMDVNYILGREQVSLHNADIASDVSARRSHREMARSYGRMLSDAGFPHSDSSLDEAQRASFHDGLAANKGAAK